MMLLTIAIMTGRSFGFTDPYVTVMSSAISDLYQCQTADRYRESANRFERIAARERARWLPYYYASYAYIQISFMEQDMAKRDIILDKAQQLLDSAMKLAPDESEVYVLQALLNPSRILVDPMGRGMLYMGKTYEMLNKAKSLNPENPRIYFLEAINTLNMPEAMGGGADKAKPLFELAQTKFNNFTPADSLAPAWGGDANEAQLQKLK